MHSHLVCFQVDKEKVATIIAQALKKQEEDDSKRASSANSDNHLNQHNAHSNSSDAVDSTGKNADLSAIT